jgi:hypothetical protein
MALQQDALKWAGCEKIFIEQMSGAVSDRPALRETLEYACGGDTLIVWKLDRLARPMKQLIDTTENLRLRKIGFRSLTEAFDTDGARSPGLSHVQRACRVRARPHSVAHSSRPCSSEARASNRRPTGEAERG